jgi:hypothetical protein
MTISTWVKAENSLQVGILSKGEYTNNTSHWSYELLRDTSGGIYASVYPNDGTAAGRIEVGSAGQITNSIWNHVTYVWDSIGYIKIYINGTLVKHVISGVPTQMASTDYPLYIGRRYNTSFTYNTNWFYGSMDDIRLYNRALSESEIQQLYKGETCSDDIAIKPYTFTAGTPAKAAEINANFDVLYQRINTPRCTN